MASVNKVILVGNLGRDPEQRHLPSGDAVTNIAIATTDQWKDKSGNKQERTEWHRVVFFGRQAEVAGQYLKKGSQVFIEGSLRTRKYTDQAGVERYTTEIVANSMQMLGKKVDGAQPANDSGAAPAQQKAASASKPAAQTTEPSEPTTTVPPSKTPPPDMGYSDNMDDIPF